MLAAVELADDVAHARQRLLLILREVIGDSAKARVHVRAAQLFGRDFLAGGGFDQRRAGQENGAVIFDDHGFVGHGGDVGAAGRAGAHHGRNLRDPFARHACNVVENAPEVVAIGKHVRLQVQKRAARVHQVDRRQVVFLSNRLGAHVLLDRFGEVGAAFDGRIVGDDHAFQPGNAADSGDDARARRFAAVQIPGRQRRQLQEGAAVVQNGVDALVHEQLAALALALDDALRPSGRYGLLARVQLVCQRFVGGEIGLKLGAVGVDLADEFRHSGRSCAK